MTTAFSRLIFPSDHCIAVHHPEEFPETVPADCFLAADLTDRQSEELLGRYAAELGSRLLLPEVWQRLFPNTGILISCQLSGGTVHQRMEEAQAANPGRCWLKLCSFAERLTLPCPDGCGISVPEEELNRLKNTVQTFYSPELVCSYLYDLPDSIILYRQPELFEPLEQMAQNIGFLGSVRFLNEN